MTTDGRRARARLVPTGPPALAALRESVAEARGSSPLDPVTVVVPSALAGVTLRRALAAPGLAGVRFCSLPQLRRELAATGGAAPVEDSRVVRQARLRAALAARPSEWPAPASTPSGIDVLDALLVELEEQRLGGEALAALEAAGGRPAAVGRLYRSLKVEPDGAALTGAGAGTVPVVLHAPRRLPPADLELVDTLAEQGLLRVVLTLTGDREVDRPVRQLAERFDVVQDEAPSSARPRVRLSVDAEEEVREAVRDVVAHLEAGHPADRIALAYRSAVPYARLLHEQLHAAGVPHHVPRQRSLAQGLTGQALVDLLALHEQDWSRQAVLGWLSSAPVRLPDGSLPVVPRLDRLACEAGVSRGTTWDRVDVLLAELPPESDDDEALAARRADLLRLSRTLAALRAEVDLVASAVSWTELATTCTSILQRWLRPPAGWRTQDLEAGRKVEAEQRAHDEVLQAVGALAVLDGLDDPPPLGDLTARRHALASQLAGPLRESSGLGRGVLVVRLADVVGADLDHLMVLGAVEGSYPPRLREHPLLRDDVRQQTGLRTTEDRRRDERRDHLAALLTAPDVVVSAPVLDARAQRRSQPSPWLLEHATGAPQPVSFASSLLAAPTLATAQEHLVRRLLLHEPVALPLTLARGLDAVDARRRGVFGPWLGGLTVAEQVDVAERLALGRSASALQDYAVCPFRWFLGRALAVRGKEEPTEDDVSPLDRGLLVHSVLEDLVGGSLGRDPDAPWSEQEHAHAADLLDARARQLVEQGKAGRPAVWDVRVAQMRRVLRRLLLSDDAYRRARRATPRAVEMSFGLDDSELSPVEVALPSGATVALKGSVDRVDVTDSGVVVVLDYKTGKSEHYGAFPEEGKAGGADLTDRGRRLQLPLYALAARREHGTADSPTEAYYSFVDEGGTRRGGVVGPDEHERLVDVLETTTQGMADGVVPARPGAYNAWYRSFDNCGFCAFDRTCSAGRDDQWDAVRDDPRVATYTELAEGDQ